MLWPITDELAPEMMLTAEELRVVEDGLHHAEPAEPEPVAEPVFEVAAEPVLKAAAEPVLAETTQAEPETADAAGAWSTVAAPNPGAASVGHEAMLAAMSAAERPAPHHERADSDRQSHDPWPRVTAWPRRPSVARAPAPDPASLRATPSEPAPASESVAALAPAPTTAPVRHPEIVAAQPQTVAAPSPATPKVTTPSPMTIARQPAGGPLAADEAVGQTVGQTETTSPPLIDPSTVDARLSAALRLTAVPADGAPAPIPDPRNWQAPATSAVVPAAAPTSPHSPLGTGWPPKGDPNAPWPMPPAHDVPSVISAVAATRQQGSINLTEMWTQSAQEVINRGTVRVCRRCSLPVSTQAKFCRRCGTQQA
jgi:ribosomal protein L40E